MESDKEIIILGRLEGNDVTHLKGIQHFIAPHTDVIVMFWWILWVSALLIAIFKTLKEKGK